MLVINPETVRYIVSIAREFEESAPAQIAEEAGEEPVSNEPDFEELRYSIEGNRNGTKSENANDPAYQELIRLINELSDEEKINLVALTWIGRGTYTADEWKDAVDHARTVANKHTAEYLLGSPMLPDYLEEGMNLLGLEDGVTDDD